MVIQYPIQALSYIYIYICHLHKNSMINFLGSLFIWNYMGIIFHLADYYLLFLASVSLSSEFIIHQFFENVAMSPFGFKCCCDMFWLKIHHIVSISSNYFSCLLFICLRIFIQRVVQKRSLPCWFPLSPSDIALRSTISSTLGQLIESFYYAMCFRGR